MERRSPQKAEERMGSAHLQQFIDTTPKPALDLWYGKQVALARWAIAKVSKKHGTARSRNLEDIEVVNETVLRVLSAHNDRYMWDGAASFDLFFAKCLKVTVESFRSDERTADRRRTTALSHLAALPEPYAGPLLEDERISRAQAQVTVNMMIAQTRMRGQAVAYAGNLLKYADECWKPAEIAADLGVKESTLPSLRARIRSVIDDPESK